MIQDGLTLPLRFRKPRLDRLSQLGLGFAEASQAAERPRQPQASLRIVGLIAKGFVRGHFFLERDVGGGGRLCRGTIVRSRGPGQHDDARDAHDAGNRNRPSAHGDPLG